MLWLQKVLDLLRKTFGDNPPRRDKKYPPSFFRGISNECDIDDAGYLKSSAFQFSNNTAGRSDGKKELSIVWNDCDESLVVLLNQRNKKGDGPQFPCGYATTMMSKFQVTFFAYLTGDMISYERKPVKGDAVSGIQDNPYHGNLLLNGGASEQLKKNIQHTLATISEFKRREGT